MNRWKWNYKNIGLFINIFPSFLFLQVLAYLDHRRMCKPIVLTMVSQLEELEPV